MRYPKREEYDSEALYADAVDYYEAAESQYEDECLEDYYESKYNN